MPGSFLSQGVSSEHFPILEAAYSRFATPHHIMPSFRLKMRRPQWIWPSHLSFWWTRFLYNIRTTSTSIMEFSSIRSRLMHSPHYDVVPLEIIPCPSRESGKMVCNSHLVVGILSIEQSKFTRGLLSWRISIGKQSFGLEEGRDSELSFPYKPKNLCAVRETPWSLDPLRRKKCYSKG